MLSWRLLGVGLIILLAGASIFLALSAPPPRSMLWIAKELLRQIAEMTSILERRRGREFTE